MAFVDRAKLYRGDTPVRAYVHEAGWGCWGGTPVLSAISFLENALSLDQTVYDFMLAAVWHSDGGPVADIFGFSDTGVWPGNPDVQIWNVHNDELSYEQGEKALICGDVAIMVGEEEEIGRAHV